MGTKKQNLNIEYEYFKKFNSIGFIDEVGRGPLAGPVVAVCVVLRKDFNFKNKDIYQVKDSKKLSHKKRKFLAEIIKQEYFDIGIGISDHETIDRINVLQATFLAMKKAIDNLKNKPEFILIDGNLEIPNFSLPQKAIIKGDEKVFSISAASIIAKVFRDELLIQADKEFPQYGFAQHKGYGTKKHLDALQKHGPSAIHRKSFAPVKKTIKDFL